MTDRRIDTDPDDLVELAASSAAMTPGLLDQPTRFLFFTGKGGVGKTTLAAAVAAELARRGHAVSCRGWSSCIGS